jgi:nucleoside-diphosphate kinase
MEKTLVIIKPDGVKRGIVGKIISHFEDRGIILSDMFMVEPQDTQVKKHYNKFLEKGFFPRILNFMTSGKVVVVILEGYDVIKNIREMIGSTNPVDAKFGTLRNKYASSMQENIIHASESHKEFRREYDIWNPPPTD